MRLLNAGNYRIKNFLRLRAVGKNVWTCYNSAMITIQKLRLFIVTGKHKKSR